MGLYREEWKIKNGNYYKGGNIGYDGKMETTIWGLGFRFRVYKLVVRRERGPEKIWKINPTPSIVVSKLFSNIPI